MLFVSGADDDATPCAFSRDVVKLTEQPYTSFVEDCSHSRKYDFLNIGKTNVPLGFKENFINFYFHYFNCWNTLEHTDRTWCIW